jgi:hypothetical protein
VERHLSTCLPAQFHGRTLVLIPHASPYYVGQLTPEERRVFRALYPATIRAFARAGVSAAEVGRDLATRHYFDGWHPSEEGGRRLAEEVAPLVRALARRLP